MMRIDNLANHQHLLPQLAAWHAAEWRHSVPDTPDRQALLLSRTSSGAGLPQTFLALIDDTPAGFVSLLANALPGIVQAHALASRFARGSKAPTAGRW